MARRTKGSGGLYKRASDGLWVGVVELPPDHTGKRRRKTVARRDYAEAVAELRKIRAEAERLGDLGTSSPTLADWMERWLATRRGDLRPKTWAGYETNARVHIIPSLGRARLERLTPDQVRRMIEGVRTSGASSTTARYVHATLRKALADAMADGIVPRNVAAIVKPPARQAREQTILTAEESMRALRSVSDDPRAMLRWSLALMTGMRMGECLGLTRAAVDLDAGVLRVRWQLQRLPAGTSIPDGMLARNVSGGLWLTPPKSKAGERVVPIVPQLAAMLAWRLADMPLDAEALVLTDADGGPIEPREEQRAWAAMLARAEVPVVNRHGARHSTATLLRALGVDDRVIQGILGHSSVLTTYGYARLPESAAVEAMQLLGRRLTIES